MFVEIGFKLLLLLLVKSCYKIYYGEFGDQCIKELEHNVHTFWNLILFFSFFYSPENAPRLFDLIQVADDRVRPAFYYAIRDTLVANDLDQASRIAYGRVRYRVVTLKGELIETYGKCQWKPFNVVSCGGSVFSTFGS